MIYYANRPPEFKIKWKLLRPGTLYAHGYPLKIYHRYMKEYGGGPYFYLEYPDGTLIPSSFLEEAKMLAEQWLKDQKNLGLY